MTFQSGYLSEDTVVALSTPVGGAIAVVRMSGPRTFSILNQATRSQLAEKSEARKLSRAQLYLENGEHLDDALFACFPNPRSYTGEDLVEFHTHGGYFIATRLMEMLISYGARQALPGEFSFRAVRNGKMTLFQAQAVVDLIAASNETAVSLALEKLSGSQTHLLSELGANLRKLAVLSEVGIDFADQDVEEVSLPQLKIQVAEVVALLEKIQSTYTRGLRVQEGVRVILTGLPNAGKSSFFNALLEEDRSIVSELAGTTRDIIREKLTLRGKKQTITLQLEDTAGLRGTNNPIEKTGIERTHRAVREADLVLFIVDPTESFSAIQAQWNSLPSSAEIPSDILAKKTVGILTKTDLATPEQLNAIRIQLESFGVACWVSTSAVERSGISDAAQAVIEFCEKWTRKDSGELILTRLDHFTAVKAALECLQRALSVTEIDLFASDLKQSLASLSPLIGETLPDDILARVFSDFCIGK